VPRWYDDDSYDRWPRYVSVKEKHAKGARELARRLKKGEKAAPVLIEGRTITTSFWGKSWCENLERYSDFSNRLARGRTYVRNGSVVDLRIDKGRVKAFVSGSDLYEVEVRIAPVPKGRWTDVCRDCSGAIDSLVELLQGRFSKAVMSRICQQETGLFPTPSEIKFTCTCPDDASMCKHVAAVLYGIGARFDQSSELLFLLRGVNHLELMAHAGGHVGLANKLPASKKILADADLSGMFGIEIAEGKPARQPPTKKRTARATKRPAG
jgi:uncharacterized Zn finger protein